MPNDRQLNAVMDIDISQAKKKLVEITKQGNETVRTVKQNGEIISQTVTRVTGATATGAIRANTAWTALMSTWTAGIAILGQINAGTRQVVKFLTDATRAAQEDQRAIIGRNAALQATGQYTYELAQRLDEQASAYQRTLGISDTYTVEIQRQLAAQRLNAEQIETATTASLGLSRVMGGELSDNVQKIIRFLSTSQTTLRGTTVQVKENATANEKLAAMLEASSSGMAILKSEAEQTAGKAHTAAEALGEIKETIGGQIGNSPDMATAFDALGKALFGVNDNLAKTGGLGGVAAQGLLAIALAATEAGAALERMSNWFARGQKYDKDFLFGMPTSWKALNWLQHPETAPPDLNQNTQPNSIFTPDITLGLKAAFDELKYGTTGPQLPGLQIPTQPQTTTPFLDSLGGLPKRKEAKPPPFSEYMGFRPQNFTELEAAGRVMGGQVQTADMRAFIGGRPLPWDLPFRIPNLSQGTTGYSYLDNHPLVAPNMAQPATMVRGGLRKLLLEEGGQMALFNSLASGGASGFASTAGGLLGGAATAGLGGFLGMAGGPIGALLGGGIFKGLGKLFGGGGHDANRGMTPGKPIYTVAKISNVDELARAANVSRSLMIGGASSNVNWAMTQLAYSAAGGQ